MRLATARAATIVMVLAVVSASCSDDGIEEADLPGLTLQEAEAPEGTTFVTDQSGAVSIGEISGNASDQEELLADGFISGWDAIFATPGLAGVAGDPVGITPRIVDSSVFLFESDDGAASAFGRLRAETDASFSDMGTVSEETIGDLGADAYGVRVEFFASGQGPDVGILHTWRVDNLILRLVVFGDGVEDAEVRALIDLMVAKLAD